MGKDYPIQEKILNQLHKGWVREYKFHPTRKWRFDFAHIEKKIAVEIEGGTWIQGRHNRASGFIKDAEKYNQATVLGWKVLRYTPEQLGEIQEDVEALCQTKD